MQKSESLSSTCQLPQNGLTRITPPATKAVYLFLLCVFALAFPASLSFAQGGQYVPDEVLVSFISSSPAVAAPGLATANVGVVAGRSTALNTVRLKLNPGVSVQAAIAALRQRADVLYAEPNYIRRVFATPNDPDYATQQYAPQKVKADLAWDIWQPQTSVTIAIVDTGVDYNHPDLTSVLVRDTNGNVVGYNSQTGTSNAQDDYGHGTHCAGIAAAQTNNGTGIAGIAGWNPNVANSNTYIKILPVKVLDSSGSGTDADVADGITWAADHGAKVISLSLGGPDYTTTLNNACQYAWSQGCIIVAAAGNDGVSALSYPAAYTNVISVASTTSSDTLSYFSNYGSWVKVAAPGSSIYSTLPTQDTGTGLGTNYGFLSGTSMATPHVAGEAALLFAQSTSLTNSQVSSLITTNVDTYSPYFGHQIKAGAGRINVYKALLAITSQPTPASLTIDWPNTRGGNSVTGTVTLNAAASTGGAIVTLSSSNSSVTSVPASVTVAAGQTSATFSITTTPVTTLTGVTIMASSGGSAVSASLNVYTSAPDHMTFNPSPVRGGNLVTGTLYLNGKAPTGGLVVNLASENTSLATVPATVTVAAGQSTATFTVTTYAVSASTLAVIDAAVNGVSIRIGFTVVQAAPEHITFNPNPVRGGNTVTATLYLNGAAPTGGLLVNLASENTALVQVPATVTVPAGAKQVTFPVTTGAVATSSLGVVDAAANGVSIRIGVTIVTSAPEHIAFSPNTVKGGGTVTGTLILNGKAPAGGLLVTLASENTALAQVPASVTVPAGASQVSFIVTTSAVLSSTLAVVDAAANGVSIRIGFTVIP